MAGCARVALKAQLLGRELTWYSVMGGTFEGKQGLMVMDNRGYFRSGMVTFLVSEGRVLRFILQISSDNGTNS